jgi:hypothetical protein
VPVTKLTDRIKMLMLKGGLIAVLLVLAFYTGRALARDARAPKPIPIPAAHAKARATCPLNRPLKCRAALVHAYEAIAWQQKQNLELAREMVGKLTDWTCIHNGRKGAHSVGSGEGPWNANTGNGYYGGLQMDRSFMRTYGRDMIRRHHGGLANTWTPREQLIVAQRAFAQGRGYNPWPTTGRACGLIA